MIRVRDFFPSDRFCLGLCIQPEILADTISTSFSSLTVKAVRLLYSRVDLQPYGRTRDTSVSVEYDQLIMPLLSASCINISVDSCYAVILKLSKNNFLRLLVLTLLNNNLEEKITGRISCFPRGHIPVTESQETYPMTPSSDIH